MNFKLLAFKRSSNKITVWIEQPSRQIYIKSLATEDYMDNADAARQAIIFTYTCAVNEWLEMQKANLFVVMDAIEHQQSYIAAGFNIPKGSKL